MTLDKNQPEIVSFLKITNNVEEIPVKLESIETVEIDNSIFTEIPSNAFNANPWNFDNAELLKIKTDLLSKHGKFGDYAKVRVGIQVLWDKAYHLNLKEIRNDRTILCDSHLEKDFLIEVEACRPLIVNSGFYPFCSDSTNTYAIFPYDIINGRKVQILFEDYCERYPLAGRYLSQYESIIKENVETYPDNKWHLFTRENNHQRVQPKVLIPMTANDTFATVTQNPSNYCDNANMFFIDIPNKDEINLYAIASIINSTLFSVCARSIANPQQNGYFKFNKQFIDPIPFPKVFYENNPELVQKIAHLGQEIEQIQIQFLTSSPRQKNILRNSLNNLWGNLDKKVYELYQLTSIEIEFFDRRGRNINRIEIIDHD